MHVIYVDKADLISMVTTWRKLLTLIFFHRFVLKKKKDLSFARVTAKSSGKYKEFPRTL